MGRLVRKLPPLRSLPLLARGHVYPDGGAYLELSVEGGGAEITFDRQQVLQLEEKIAAFKAFVAFEDGRPMERMRPHREAL